MKKIKIILGLWIFLWMFSSCSDVSVQFIPEEEIPETLTSHFDLARLVKADVKRIMNNEVDWPEGQNLNMVPSDGYISKTLIRYPEGYSDEYGNTYSGRVAYSTNMEGMAEGKIELITFHDFHINNLRVEGAKATQVTRMSGDGSQVVGIDWCQFDDEGAAPENRGMTIHLEDGTTVALRGCVSKELNETLYESEGLLEYAIQGEMYGRINDGMEWEYRINDLSHGNNDCRWYEKGLINVSNGTDEFEMNMSDDGCSSAYAIHYEGGVMNFERYHDFWN